MRSILAAAALASALLVAAPARAGDTLYPSPIHEIKLGALYHDPGFLWSHIRREHGIDGNFEVVLAPSLAFLGGTVRPAFGATLNGFGGTSRGYAYARWQIEGPMGLYLALGLGAAVHDGTAHLVFDDRKALGSRHLLFHIPLEIGIYLDRHSSVSIYFEHMSNAYSRPENEGLDTIGLRYGYRF